VCTYVCMYVRMCVRMSMFMCGYVYIHMHALTQHMLRNYAKHLQTFAHN